MSGIMGLLVGSGAADIVRLTAATVTDTTSGSTAWAQIQLTQAGLFQDVSGSPVTLQNWVVPGTSGPKYEVFATLVSGVLTTGTAGSWLALSSTRGWSRNRTTIGTNTTIVNLAIRLVGTTTTLTNADITITATYGA